MSNHPPIAIVGLSALFPDSIGCGCFWRNIVDGRDLISDVPPSHWLIDDYYDPSPGDADKTYCKRGGFLPDIDFDPLSFGIPPNVIPSTDTTQLLALIAARQVLQDAFEEQFEEMDKEKMSIVLGVTAGQELLIQAAARLQRPQWLAALREEGIAEPQAQQICDRIAEKYTPWQENTFPGLLGNVVAGRIANRFDLGGTNCITDAACASSLSALSMGLNELYLGHSDVVITGGVDCFNDIFMYMCFSKTPALSQSGECRPFGQGADGTLMGEGLGMFALKRLEDAEDHGDQIYAVIRGLGSSSDGRSLSVYAPLPKGQAKAIERAHQRSGVAPETVELVEAHGTATKAGDVAEFKGLCHAFGVDEEQKSEASGSPWCALGSIKSQIGHTKAAAGAAGLFKIAMALHHRVLPPTIKVDRPSDKLRIENTPFYVNAEARPWIRGDDHPRRAGISSFGFGGSNFHVVVEEYTGEGRRPGRKRSLSAECFAWSATSVEALRHNLQAVLDDLQERPEQPAERRELLAFVARESQRGFDPKKPHRVTMLADDIDSLFERIETVNQRLAQEAPKAFELPGGIFYRVGRRDDGDLAMLFPGQGSQYVGMGAGLAMNFDAARQVWDEAAAMGLELHRRVYPPPAFDEASRDAQQAELTATEWAQPAIGAASAATVALLGQLGLRPDAVAGHSFGEVTALHAAGALNRQTMLAVARKRGQLMAQAASSTSGAMTAVRLGADEVSNVLDEHQLDVVIANDNAPGQVVVSGSVAAIEEAEAVFDEALLAYKRLPVDTAFHSRIVAEATEPFVDYLGDIDTDELSVAAYANSTAAPYLDDPSAMRSTLGEQIENPVRFVEMIQAMADDGVTTFVEVGPGNVLSGLAERCLIDHDVEVVSLDHRQGDDIESFLAGLAQLSALGIELDFEALWQGYDEPEDPRAKQRSEFTVKINGANYDRPYPPKGGPDEVPAPNWPEESDPSPTDSHHYINGPTTQEPTMSNDDYTGHGAMPPYQDMDRRQPSEQPTPPQPQGGASAQAFAEYQRTLADSHMAYLRMMEQSVTSAQMAYMEAMEKSFRQWCAGEGQPVAKELDEQATSHVAQPQPPRTQSPQPRQDWRRPVESRPRRQPAPGRYEANGRRPPAYSQANSGPNQPAPAPAVPNGQTNGRTPTSQPSPVNGRPPANGQVSANGRASGARASAPSRTPDETPESAPTPAASPDAEPTGSESPDLTTTFMDVVADKTGYPVDMIDDSMALEADLGIDSIKRVEILSAVQEEVPSLPELDPNAMASLKTVGEIVGYLEKSGGSGGTSAGGRLGK